MRKKYLFFVLILFATGSFAQKVALHTSTGIEFFIGTNALVNAYSTATSGDTLYLSGGGFTSPTTIDKGLRIYGAGHYPDSTLTTGKTFLNGNITLSENADGMHFEGIDLNGTLITTNNHAVDQVTFKYCRLSNLINIQGTLVTPCNNWLFINCVFIADLTLTNAQYFAFYNSIFQGRILSSSGHLFENNAMLYSYNSASVYVVHGNNNICSNNIFLMAFGRYITGNANQAFNNIFITTPELGNIPIYSGNYYPVAQGDIFVSQSGITFDYSHNYHLKAPETYLGTDGTEVGIYGGAYPYKEGAVPSNPHIFRKNIGAQTNNMGQLNIEIGVEAQER
jgi:hypothetical protein